MQIVALRLKNIKSFGSLHLSFATDALRPRPWTLLLGDNASGKTTILRCIAIGTNDESSAAGLVREMRGSIVRKTHKDSSEGVILIGLVDARGKPYTIKTVLKPIPKTGDRVRQRVYKLPADEVPDGPFPTEGDRDPGRIEPERFPWDKLFVCGYGAGRSIDGREEYTDYRTIDAVYTLFRYDQPLQSPEMAWRKYRHMIEEASKRKGRTDVSAAHQCADSAISTLLGEVMDPDGNLRPVLKPAGIFLPHGNRLIALPDHADGYRSITTWLLDFVAWHILFSGATRLESLSGVVLVDEIEQHLHPRWQRYLIGRLRKQFPRVQFIATTHAPLCAASAADLTADECALIHLAYEPRKREVIPSEPSLPYGRRADQILKSSAFDLYETMNPEVGDRLAEYRQLFRKTALTGPDRARKNELEEWLTSHVPDLLLFQHEYELTQDLKRLKAEARPLRLEEEGN